MTLNEYCEALRGRSIAVIGYGVSNRPLVRILLDHGLDVTVRDKRECEVAGARCICGEGYLDELTEDVIFRTPGLMPHSAALAAAVARGAELTSEMEAFFDVCPCRIIAITGSDGKTTTSTIIATALAAAGHTVHLGGNIGTPLLERADDMASDDFVVLELSSFQLITMRKSPNIAVVTNVTPNHLDIHRDFAEYVEAKRNVLAYQDLGDLVVLNAKDEVSRGFVGSAAGTVQFFNASDEERGARLRDGALCFNNEAVVRADEIKIPGSHNVENYLAAIAALAGVVPFEILRETARTFGGVEHRCELVRELRGVRFYNDSIASSPTRTIAGLRSFPEKVILIAGGKDKGIAYDEIGPEIIKHVKKLFLTGVTAEKIRAAVENCAEYRGEPPIVTNADFAETVRLAAGAAESGDVVILSPASTSFDRFANFEERGKYFKELIHELD